MRGKELAERHDLPAVDNTDELVKKIAMDVGKAVAHHIETMYPAAVGATTPNMVVSVKGCVFNEIMTAIKITDEGQIERRLVERKKHRREIKAAYTKMRK